MSKKISLGGFFKAPAKKKMAKIGGFGLQPSKPKAAVKIKQTLDLFKQAAEEDEFDRGKSAINRSLVSQKAQDKTQKLIDAAHATALAEDPNAFDYDGVYDDIQEKRQAAMEGHALNQGVKREKRQSKYIGSMLEKTKIREKEQDRIFEKRLLKEREEEDRLFGDKEKLITASYRRKLEENKKYILQI